MQRKRFTEVKAFGVSTAVISQMFLESVSSWQNSCRTLFHRIFLFAFIVPYAGIDLAVYETLKKKYLAQHTEQEAPQIWLLLACGSVSSTLGQVCSYPLALVRTRLQAHGMINQTYEISNVQQLFI